MRQATSSDNNNLDTSRLAESRGGLLALRPLGGRGCWRGGVHAVKNAPAARGAVLGLLKPWDLTLDPLPRDPLGERRLDEVKGDEGVPCAGPGLLGRREAGRPVGHGCCTAAQCMVNFWSWPSLRC